MGKRLTEKDFLAEVEKSGSIATVEVAKRHNVSRQYAWEIAVRLLDAGKIKRMGGGPTARYVLPGTPNPRAHSVKLRLENSGLEEDVVYSDIEQRLPGLQRVSENVRSILRYAFTEMMNNAIEHSKSKFIQVEVTLAPKEIRFQIKDTGIGVYANIKKKRGLTSELHALQDLLKGKVTTQPHLHTGEGIFFTSRAGDLFELDSHELRLRFDQRIPDVFVEELPRKVRGTSVNFSVALVSKKHLSEVFGEFAKPDNFDFHRTHVYVRLYAAGSVYISRSQARRILAGLDEFTTITLDFDRVPTIGQAFADEVFRVFLLNNPGKTVESANANPVVQMMIDRTKTDQQETLFKAT